MKQLLAFVLGTLVLAGGAGGAGAQNAGLDALLPELRAGGHVIVLRHGPTDQGQQDVVPFDFADMSKQRQLSEEGRNQARQIGAALAALGVPIGEVYTSRLNRAVETGRLIAGKDPTAVDELTDSSGGNQAAMAGNAGGGDEELGGSLREMVAAAPADGANTLIVTHKTNIADAFGADFGNVAEGEAAVFRPDGADGAAMVGRVQAAEWIAAAGM